MQRLLKLVSGGGAGKMPDKAWRERLKQAVKRDGRSYRAISMAANLHETAVWELLNPKKEPGIDKVVAVATEIGVTVGWIFDGIELSPESERLLKAWGRMSKDEREAFLEFVESQKKRR